METEMETETEAVQVVRPLAQVGAGRQLAAGLVSLQLLRQLPN
jgi:hypothetical protein